MSISKSFFSRRFFFARTAAGIVGIAALGVRYSAGEMKAAGPTKQVLAVAEASEFALLDAQFASLGRPRIEARLQNGTVEKKIYALEWIEMRGHKPLYDLICRSVVDGRMKVREVALRLLVNMDPVLLKPHLGILQSAAPGVKRNELKVVFTRLLNDVELS